MARIEKTVFISYRRNNPWGLSIFQNLTQHGYDVFIDFKGIASGDFERVILENINARAHFLVLLTPSALERCGDPSDWLRREIETALESQRNIIPIELEGFDFSSRAIEKQLTGKLATLKNYNALRVSIEYFEEAMGRLREEYLNVPLEAVLHPASSIAKQTAKAQQAAASSEEANFLCYSEAIRLNRDDPAAYKNRDNARFTQLVRHLSAYQIRSHYIFYRIFKELCAGESGQLGRFTELQKFTMFIPFEVWEIAMNLQPNYQQEGHLEHVMYGLSREGLIDGRWLAGGGPERLNRLASIQIESDGIVYRPSAVGVELYLWGSGLSEIPVGKFLVSEFTSMTVDGLVIPDGAERFIVPNSPL